MLPYQNEGPPCPQNPGIQPTPVQLPENVSTVNEPVLTTISFPPDILSPAESFDFGNYLRFSPTPFPQGQHNAESQQNQLTNEPAPDLAREYEAMRVEFTNNRVLVEAITKQESIIKREETKIQSSQQKILQARTKIARSRRKLFEQTTSCSRCAMRHLKVCRSVRFEKKKGI